MDSSSNHSTAQKLFYIIPETALNSWEIEELLDCLTQLPHAKQDLLLHQISVIWPVSHSLCLAFLDAVRPALGCLDNEQFAAWVRGILDRYESQGLQEARRFMADLNIFLTRFFHTFTNPGKAMAIYHFLQTFRALSFLQKRLPGLMDDSTVYFQTIAAELAATQKKHLLATEYGFLLAQLGNNHPLELPLGPGWNECSPSSWWHETALIFLDTARIYGENKDTADLPLAHPPFFQGSFLVAEAHARRLSRRKEVEQQFLEALSIRILPSLARKKETNSQDSSAPDSPQQPDSGVNLTIRPHRRQARRL